MSAPRAWQERMPETGAERPGRAQAAASSIGTCRRPKSRQSSKPSIPRGRELLKLFKIWPGADASNPVTYGEAAQQWNVERSLVAREVDRALDECFGPQAAAAYAAMRSAEMPAFGPPDYKFDAAAAATMLCVLGPTEEIRRIPDVEVPTRLEVLQRGNEDQEDLDMSLFFDFEAMERDNPNDAGEPERHSAGAADPAYVAPRDIEVRLASGARQPDPSGPHLSLERPAQAEQPSRAEHSAQAQQSRRAERPHVAECPTQAECLTRSASQFSQVEQPGRSRLPGLLTDWPKVSQPLDVMKEQDDEEPDEFGWKPRLVAAAALPGFPFSAFLRAIQTQHRGKERQRQLRIVAGQYFEELL